MDDSAQYRARLIRAALTGIRVTKAYESFVTTFCNEVSDDYLSADSNPRVPAQDARIAQRLWNLLRSNASDEVHVDVVEGAGPRDLTTLFIVHPDMPFITDSVLMDLTRHDIAIHFLHNVTLTAKRNARGGITGIHNKHTQFGQTLIYLEMDPLLRDECAALVTRVTDALTDVRAAFADYGAMQSRVRSLIEELGSLPDRRQVEQAQEYLHWLLADHFTFLGYREFNYADNQIRQVAGSELGTMRNRRSASVRPIAELRAASRAFLKETSYLSFSKSGTRSRVHRPAYPDYVAVKRFDPQGNVVGECGFYGLYTSPVYTDHPNSIPVLRDKTQAVVARAGLDPKGFDGKNLVQVLVTYPRDELFQIDVDTLYRNCIAVAHLHERRQTRVFVRAGRYGLFFNCLVYVPRELYNTKLRTRLEALLAERYHALDIDFDAFFSESILVRLQFILRVDPEAPVRVDVAQLQADVVALADDWHYALRRSLRATPELEIRAELVQHLPSGYEEFHDIARARADLTVLTDLDERQLHVEFVETSQLQQLRLLTRSAPLSLSKVVPLLENLGFAVHNERSFVFGDSGYAIHEYTVAHPAIPPGGVFDAALLNDAIVHVNRGTAANDGFNRLVVGADVGWREVSVLRAYAAYMKQAGFAFDEHFLINTLVKHAAATRCLVEHFLARFDPDGKLDPDCDVESAVSDVSLFNEDRAIRKLFELVAATVRTNYFLLVDGQPGNANLALKLRPELIEGLPKPVPRYEVFVFGPGVEGVHLRSSAVARGGIRWSDRSEDYRTEVLDLMKTQVVKNALIVPSGAKGGFLVKGDGAATREAGRACYRMFIQCLLDVTDNIVEGVLVHPPRVRCHDGEDPYLVVAADKGTATFSDDANELAEARGYWLGDAFASGGKTGYDHKKMGITAKGGWVSVARHFKELGVDVQQDPVTVVGIGDMSGDVFGNGLLLSQSLLLVGAFNHLHVFLDPNPDPLTSFRERQRLFADRLGWDGYDQALISPGGGVFPRTMKAIAVTPEVAKRLGIAAPSVSPDELISHLLRARVDLLWNGGVGTYVKAREQRHADVGDRANDALRVDAQTLGVKVIGEGGNLGLTQAARVVFARNGGAINADFIDNSGGVDCSDHEVNLKILLNMEVAARRLTLAERNEMLRANEDAVAALVLDNNARQAQALSLAQAHCKSRGEEYARFIDFLEQTSWLDRMLHGLPTRDELDERSAANGALTRPELAVLMCCAKNWLKTQLQQGSFIDDPFLTGLLARQFPPAIGAAFAERLGTHPLAREIIATQLTNEVIDHMGATFVHQVQEITGASTQEVVAAYVIVTNLAGFVERWNEVEASGTAVGLQISALLDYVRFGHRAARWLLQRHRGAIDIAALLTTYREGLGELLDSDPTAYLSAVQRRRFRQASQRLVDAGFAVELAQKLAAASELISVMSIAEIAAKFGLGRSESIKSFVTVGRLFKINALNEGIASTPVIGRWQTMEREALLDEVAQLKVRLAGSMAASRSTDTWRDRHESLWSSWHRIMDQYRAGGHNDLAFAALTLRKLTSVLDLSL